MLRSLRQILLLTLITPAAFAGETTTVAMGNAILLPLSDSAAQVVVGNPAVADVSLQSPHVLALFGKYPGGTSLLVTDHAGRTILKTSILVTAADADGVTIRYGTGKTWTPGGTVAAVACGAGRCAPTTPVPAQPSAPSGGSGLAAVASALAPTSPQH